MVFQNHSTLKLSANVQTPSAEAVAAAAAALVFPPLCVPPLVFPVLPLEIHSQFKLSLCLLKLD